VIGDAFDHATRVTLTIQFPLLVYLAPSQYIAVRWSKNHDQAQDRYA